MRSLVFAGVFSLVLLPQPGFAQPAQQTGTPQAARSAPVVDEDAGWNFAHPDATLVGSIRPSAILNSPLLAAILEAAGKKQIAAPGAPQMDPAAALGMARVMLGGVTEVRFSFQDTSKEAQDTSQETGAHSNAAPATGAPQLDVVAVVLGHLDDSLLGLMTQNQAQNQVKTRRIDANTVLIGTGPSLEAAAVRMAGTGVTLRPKALQGTATLVTSDLWLSGQLPATPMTDALKDKLRGLALGLNVRDNLELELDMNAATAAMAQELVKQAQSAEAQQPAQFRGMLQSYVEGSVARFRMTVPRDRVLEGIRSGMVPGMPGATPSASAGGTPAPLPPPVLIDPNTPPQRRTIKIQGLDEGPREIPLDPSH